MNNRMEKEKEEEKKGGRGGHLMHLHADVSREARRMGEVNTGIPYSNTYIPVQPYLQPKSRQSEREHNNVSEYKHLEQGKKKAVFISLTGHAEKVSRTREGKMFLTRSPVEKRHHLRQCSWRWCSRRRGHLPLAGGSLWSDHLPPNITCHESSWFNLVNKYLRKVVSSLRVGLACGSQKILQ